MFYVVWPVPVFSTNSNAININVRIKHIYTSHEFVGHINKFDWATCLQSVGLQHFAVVQGKSECKLEITIIPGHYTYAICFIIFFNRFFCFILNNFLLILKSFPNPSSRMIPVARVLSVFNTCRSDIE